MERQRTNHDTIEHRVIVSHYRFNALVNRYHTIASSRFRFIVSSHHRHHIVASLSSRYRNIASRSSHHCHCIILSLHYRCKPQWCNDAIIDYMIIPGFHTIERVTVIIIRTQRGWQKGGLQFSALCLSHSVPTFFLMVWQRFNTYCVSS